MKIWIHESIHYCTCIVHDIVYCCVYTLFNIHVIRIVSMHVQVFKKFEDMGIAEWLL